MLFDTDYLVVGAGATGLAFADSLVAEADVEVIVIDREPTPRGHWLHAYPFVRLHTPSAYYGVNSLALAEDQIDESGENAGYYERATGGEVREYFVQAAARLVQTGRVRLLTGHEHLGGGTGRVVLQQVRHLSPSFNAARLGFIEAHRDDDADKLLGACHRRDRETQPRHLAQPSS